MNFGSLLGVLGMARQNPQRVVANMLQQAYNSGRIDQGQFQVLNASLSSGANPNIIIQQLLNSGVASQQQYEIARQQAASLNSK
jgi:hypothetical protein